MFNARRAPRNLKRKLSESDGEGEKDGTSDSAQKLIDVREMQKETWHRKRGVLPMPIVKDAAEEEEEEDEKWGLDSGFAGSSASQKADPHLEAYLNERLYAKTNTEEQKKEKTREERLYEIPTELQVPDAAVEAADKMSWMAGLAEVPLGVEYKLANIEATEKAKREFLHGERSQQGNPVLEPDAVTRKAFGSRFMNFNDKSMDSKSATDDAALDRFRKRMRR
eukprot:TRINITY_DN54731_c0_g1_i1.p1 TRINITY_DN54731_c0_g1~~TRINITY_DN54731_c0_g1_i1.p1  ORF type:complete len:223 (+),score=56.08 TRINITY_DN54731_c0_g1_i1:120-788(+)